MVERGKHGAVCMSRDKKKFILGGTPFVHDDVVFIDQFERVGYGVHYHFEVALNRCPYCGDEPFAEGVAIAALVTLVAVGEEDLVLVIIVVGGQ